jgi:uncharacterized membrane protein YebE (DUF533 family)
MFDPKVLLDQVLGGGAGTQGNAPGRSTQSGFNPMGGGGSFAGGAAVGGLLGLVLGNKKMRKFAGGGLGYGGAAVLGALAHRAYQNYQQGQAPKAPSPTEMAALPELQPQALPHAVPAADGRPFELVLVQAMIAAAKADGHVDADEQRHLFSEVERMDLDGEAKAFVFDALSQQADLAQLASAAAGEEQAAELYLASRLAIDPDHPAERAYLDALAARLRLPVELRAHLDKQVGD